MGQTNGQMDRGIAIYPYHRARGIKMHRKKGDFGMLRHGPLLLRNPPTCRLYAEKKMCQFSVQKPAVQK